jgi:uncharacterized membrane protein
MVKPQWHDGLRHELRKRGLPPTYSARLIEELTDHFTDLQKENLSMEAQTPVEEQLGSPELLARAAEKEFVGQTFAGRHPLAAFVMAPIPAIVLMLSGIVIGWQFCGWLINLIVGNSATQSGFHSLTAGEQIVIYGFLSFWRVVPFVLTAWFFIRLGRSAGRPMWGSVACGIIACLAIFFSTSFSPATELHGNLWLIGFGRFPSGLEQLLQAALPAALGLWAWWRSTYRPKNLQWPDAAPSSAPTPT